MDQQNSRLGIFLAKTPKKRYRLSIRRLKSETPLLQQVGKKIEEITEEDLKKALVEPKKLEK